MNYPSSNRDNVGFYKIIEDNFVENFERRYPGIIKRIAEKSYSANDSKSDKKRKIINYWTSTISIESLD